MRNTISVIKDLISKCKKDNINAYAAQSAFFIILSVIPFLMVFSSLVQYTTITESVLIGYIDEMFPSYLAPFFISLVNEVYKKPMGLISITALIAIWSSAKGIHYVTEGLNVVHERTETRNWIVLRFWAVVDTVIFLLAIVLTLVLLVFGNSLLVLVMEYFPFFSDITKVVARFRVLGMIVLLAGFFCIVFKVIPNRRLSLKKQLPGAVLCSVAWYLYSFGLSVYVDYFHGFSMYGSLTTIALVMLWLYFCMYIMFAAAELNVVLESYLWKELRERDNG